MVQFSDGSIKAQMGRPDMRFPIQYALCYPNRLDSDFPRLCFADYPNLSFETVDTLLFRNLSLAFEAMKMGGNMPCVMNASNEIAVDAFLNGKSGFMEMSSVIEKTMEKATYISNPKFDDYIDSDKEARGIASLLIKG